MYIGNIQSSVALYSIHSYERRIASWCLTSGILSQRCLPKILIQNNRKTSITTGKTSRRKSDLP